MQITVGVSPCCEKGCAAGPVCVTLFMENCPEQQCF